MTRHYKSTLIAFALLFSSLLPVAANAQLTPNYVRPREPGHQAATRPAPKIAF